MEKIELNEEQVSNILEGSSIEGFRLLQENEDICIIPLQRIHDGKLFGLVYERRNFLIFTEYELVEIKREIIPVYKLIYE